MKLFLKFILLGFLIIAGGCASDKNMPLVFGQTQTVGISIGTGASGQGVNFVLGYNDKDIALIPVSLQTKKGEYAQITSKAGDKFKDALSVLGQFSVSSDTSKGNVGLGKFFATGAAAKSLADGFKEKMRGNVTASPAPK